MNSMSVARCTDRSEMRVRIGVIVTDDFCKQFLKGILWRFSLMLQVPQRQSLPYQLSNNVSSAQINYVQDEKTDEKKMRRLMQRNVENCYTV